MSRVDVPTLRCDRCHTETQNALTMVEFSTLTRLHMSGQEEWDLCPKCWAAFKGFIARGQG